MSYYKLMLQHTPQTEWADTAFLLEMTCGALGGGMFIAGAAAGLPWLCLIGFVLATVCKGLLLLKDLGKPMRALKVMARPFGSWLSFGAWNMLLFGVFGLLYLLLMFTGAGVGGLGGVLGLLAGICALIMISYDGLLMASSTAIASWSSGMLAPLFCVNALSAGCAAAAALGAGPVFIWAVFVLLLAELLILAAHIAALRGGSTGARESWQILSAGAQKGMFMYGALLLGVIAPLIVLSVLLFGVMLPQVVLMLIAALCAIGVFCMRASLLRAGVTTPVI